MWPFGTSRAFDRRTGAVRRRRATRTPSRRSAIRLETASAHAQGLVRAGRSAHVEVARTHRVGYLQPRGAGETEDGRRLPPLPMLQIVVPPGESIDFADPVVGFPGYEHLPPPERVLELWTDDLLTVSHGVDWTYVVRAEDSFPRPWLKLLERPADAPFGQWYAIVCAAFMGPTPAGEFRMAEVDATQHTTLVHIADRRRPAARRPVTVETPELAG